MAGRLRDCYDAARSSETVEGRAMVSNLWNPTPEKVYEVIQG